MLQFSPFFLKFVVILLQYLYELFEILDLLLVVQLYLVSLNSIVLGHVRHLAQNAVLGNAVLHLVAQSVDFRKEVFLLLHCFCFLLPQVLHGIKPLFAVATAEQLGQVCVETAIFVSKLLLLKGQLLNLTVEYRKFFLLVFTSNF